MSSGGWLESRAQLGLSSEHPYVAFQAWGTHGSEFLDGSSHELPELRAPRRAFQGAQKGVSSLTMEFPECHFRCVL